MSAFISPCFSFQCGFLRLAFVLFGTQGLVTYISVIPDHLFAYLLRVLARPGVHAQAPHHPAACPLNLVSTSVSCPPF